MPHITCSIDGCPATAKARGLCSRHYTWHQRHGTLPPRRSAADRFWEKVDTSGDCWIWLGSKSLVAPARGEYRGYFFLDGKMVAAPRAAWILTNGPIPDGLCALHHCDVPLCVRPDHLYVGDKKQNAADRETRGRGRQPRGESHLSAKLTEDQVREIRKDTRPQTVIAREYGVSNVAIRMVQLRRTWKHVV